MMVEGKPTIPETFFSQQNARWQTLIELACVRSSAGRRNELKKLQNK
jgi:hypothetical protein